MPPMSSVPRRHVPRAGAPLLALALLASLLPGSIAAAGTPDQILVRFRDGTPPETRAAIARAVGLSDPAPARGTSPGTRAGRADRAATLRTERYESTGRSLAALQRLLADDPNVVAVGTNGRYELQVDPPSGDDPSDEPFYADLWGLDNSGQTVAGNTTTVGTAGVDIDGREAFAYEQGAPSVVVAVVDDGIDFSHVDLADRAWTNPGESGDGRETNGIDDDGNDFVDDVYGWDFCNNDNTVHDPGEDAHGTHVAGTIAASRNGTGVVGVAPGIKLMAVKFIDNSTSCGKTQMAVDAIDYAASFGVRLVNASWGSYSPSNVLDQAIADSGSLLVAAAGNQSQAMDSTGSPFYPAASTLSNIVSVAAIDETGELAWFSNHGKTSVDIAAPGTNILSTYPAIGDCLSSCYRWLAGTSMAAPHVTGVAALIGSRSASVLGDPLQLKARLLATGMPLASTAGLTVTGKLVNAYRAVDPVPPVALPVSRHGINANSIVGSTSVSTSMTWAPATDDLSGVASYWLLRSVNGSGWQTITSTTTSRIARLSMVFGSSYRFRLRAEDNAGNIGPGADGPEVKASIVQEGTSLARYTGSWSSRSDSSSSGSKVRSTTSAGASVEFTFTARAVGIVAPKGSTRGRVKVYVDGVYARTVDLYRSASQARVVVFAQSWETTGRHRVKLVTIATSGRTRVDIDGAVFLK